MDVNVNVGGAGPGSRAGAIAGAGASTSTSTSTTTCTGTKTKTKPGAAWARHAAYLPAGAAGGFAVGVVEGLGAVGGEVATSAIEAVRFVINTSALPGVVGAAVGAIFVLLSVLSPEGARLSTLWRRLRAADPARVSAAIFAGAVGVGLLFVATYVAAKTIVDLSRHQAALALAVSGVFLIGFVSTGMSVLTDLFARWRMPRPRVALAAVLLPILVVVMFIVRAERDRIEAMPLAAYAEITLVTLLPMVLVAIWRRRAVRWATASLASIAGGAAIHFAVAFTPTEALHIDFNGKLTREILQRVAFLRPRVASEKGESSGARASASTSTSTSTSTPTGTTTGTITGTTTGTNNGAAVKIPDGLSVVLITVDTLRADRLGCYGYARPTSPQIDRLAASGVRFERAYSTASLTSQAIPPMLTSRYISEMNRTFEHFIKFTPDNVGFPSLLQKAGIRTVGMASHWYIGKPFGFTQGFDVWDTSAMPAKPYEVDETSTSEPLTKAAQRQLEAFPAGKRFLLWIHYLDPHKNFLEHPGFPSFGKSDADRYDGEIAYMDHFIGQLVDTLAKRPDAGKIAVMFLSDHGEGLGNHNHMHHGWNAFEELVRIPFIIMAPGATPRVLPGPISIIDVAPTLLDIFGVPVPKEFRGRSLAPVLWGNATTPPERPILIDMPKGPTNPFIRALIQSDAEGDWKLIYWADRKVYQLFNLRDDPKELQNLARKNKDRFASMKAEMERWFSKELQLKKARGTEDEDETEQ